MNSRLNFFKRLTAFLLAMLLVTSMMGDDFFSLATSDEIITEESVDSTDASAEPEATPAPESVDMPAEPQAEDIADVTEEQPADETEATDPETPAEPSDPQPAVDENGNPIEQNETPEEPKESVDDANTPNPENIDSEEVTEEEEEVIVEEAEEETEEDEECEHEMEYISNGDGTHIIRCSKCGEEQGTDYCDFDENGVCRLCGYEDMSLTYQKFSKEILGTTVTVEGEMPRNADVTIYYVGKKAMENIVNDYLDEGVFKAYAAYDITIYDRHGNKYQPDYDNNTVKVTFESVNKLDEVPDEEVTVFRIEDDYSVTEIEADASGEDVSFDAEHFSTYVTGQVGTSDYVEIYDYNHVAYIGTAEAGKYTRALYAGFDFYADAIGDYVFTAQSYKNLRQGDDPTDGTLASESNGSVTVHADSVGWQNVRIPLREKVTGNGYVSGGYSYSVVVAFESSPSNHVYFKYNNGDSTTYISKGDIWSAETGYNGIFQVVSGDTIEVTDIPNDSYEIASVNSENNKMASASEAVYAIGETDTLTAVLNEAAAERTINWTVEPSSTDLVSIESVSSNPMAVKLNALKPGMVTLKATYRNTNKTSSVNVTVHIVDIKLGGDSSKEGVVSHTESYTGTGVVPVVAVNTTGTGGTVSSYYYATDTTVKSSPYGTGVTSVSSLTYPYTISRCDESTNTNVGTAHINIKYYYNASKTYSYDRVFKINPLDITDTTAFAGADFSIENGEVKDITKINTNNALPATPVFKNGDITASIEKTEFATDGIKYTYKITGQGNYTGTVNVEKVIRGSSIDQVVRVELNPNSQFSKYYEYTGKDYDLDAHCDANGDWSDLIFYDMQNQPLPAGTINKTNATATINTVDTTDKDSKNAGLKEIVVTLKSGYTGSIKTPGFRIYPRSLSEAKVNWVNNTGKFKYTGNPIEPKECSKDSTTDGDFYVTLNTTGDAGDDIRIDNTNNQEYTISYQPALNHTNTTDSPSLVLRAAGKNFESGSSLSAGYTIEPDYALNMTIRIIDGQMYNGTNKDKDTNGYYKTGYNRTFNKTADIPTIKVLVGGNTLSESDYKIEVDDDTSEPNDRSDITSAVGTKYIKVTAKAGGQYAGGGTVTAIYNVVPRTINDAAIRIDDRTSTREKIFDNKDQLLETASNGNVTDYDIKVTYGSDYLSYGDDYEIEYTGDRVNVTSQGVSYKIVGKGNYSGSTSSKTYTIKPATLGATGTATATVEPSSYAYNGKPQYPSVNVKISNSTFTEKYIYTEATLESANFSVSYDNNVQPSKPNNPATVTITGKNNLTGSVIVPFNITSSRDEYQISINGKSAIITKDDFVNTGTRYYYCDLNATYNGTNNYGAPVVINPVTGEVLNKNGRKTDYGYGYYNTDKVGAEGEYSTSTWPYLRITGINAYNGNDAIVYFKILRVDISNFNDTNIVYTKDLAFNPTNVVRPTFTIKYGTSTLVEGQDQDYVVTCWDDKAHSVPATTKAGVKYAVIEGKGKYTGIVEREYTVGTKVSEVLVSIQSGTFDSTGNPENLTGDIWPVKVSLGQKGNSLDNPLEIPYRGNHAPKVILYSKDGNENLEGSFTISDRSPESSIGLEGDSLYDSRRAGSKDGNYNVLKYSVTMDGSKGYYSEDGNKPIDIFVRIMPQSIKPTEARISETGDTATSIEYNGGESEYHKEYRFRYGNADQNYQLEKDKDLVGYPIMIGNEIGSNLKKYVEGVGNFTDTVEYTISVNKGYVIVSGKKDTNTPDTDAKSINSKETQTLDLGALYTYKENQAQLPILKLTATNGTKELILGEDYDIVSYPSMDEQMGKVKLDENLTITIKTKGDKYVEQTITINYKIASNNIKEFYGTLSDLEYTAEKITFARIKAATLTLATAKGGDELVYGRDYELVESYEETQTEVFKNQFGETTFDTAIWSDSNPSYQNNYIFVKGKGIYSGYCKIPFNIVLNLGHDWAKVTIENERYELDSQGNPSPEVKPIIKYRKIGGTAGTWTETLAAPTITEKAADGVTDIVKTLTNYTITRDREGKPGPDGSITVEGKYNCVGKATNVKADTGKVVCFLISLSNYADLKIAGNGQYIYTNNPVTPTIRGLGDIGANPAPITIDADQTIHRHEEGDDVDYVLYYEGIDGKYTDVAKAAGKWKAHIEATANSRYFMRSGTGDEGKTLEFYIKYDLTKAIVTFTNASVVDGVQQVGYTGSPYIFADITTITDQDGETPIYPKGATPLVEIDPTAKTDMGKYTVTFSASAVGEDYCTGTGEAQFRISGISIADAAITLDNDSFEYTGKAITPKVTVKIQNGAITLTENKDYSVTYRNNIKAGTATVIVTGINNYSGTNEDTTFVIKKKALKDCLISFGDAYYIGTGNGLEVEPTVTIKNGTTELREGTDYTIVDYTNNSSIATAVAMGNDDPRTWNKDLMPKVTIEAVNKGNYTGEYQGETAISTISVPFTIERLNVETNSEVKIVDKLTDHNDVDENKFAAEFTGAKQDEYSVLKLSVVHNGVETPLVGKADGTGDYTVEILDSPDGSKELKAMGDYKLVVTGQNNCEGARIIDFTIKARSLPNNYHYYYTNTKPSTGKPGFEGTWRPLKESDFTTAADYKPGFITTGGLGSDTLEIRVYDCTTVKEDEDNIPVVTIIDRGLKDPIIPTKDYELLEERDFTLSVRNAQTAGTAEWVNRATDDNHALVAATSPAITITGQGDYTGEITLPYNIGKNINNQGLIVRYKVTDNSGVIHTYERLEQYSSYDSTGAAWSYDYNGRPQEPTPEVLSSDNKRLSSTKDYSVSITDALGNEATSSNGISTNAGYKYVVITGKGDYCGTMIQRYRIRRKKIEAEPVIENLQTIAAHGDYFTTEKDPVAKNKKADGSFEDKTVLSFKVSGLSRLNEETAKKYLKAHNLTDDQAVKYVDYYYGIYSGTPIQPTIAVYDNTLGSGNGISQISSGENGDLEITYNNDNTKTIFGDNGDIITCGEVVITFKNTGEGANDPTSSGNYYVGSASIKYTFRYIIVARDISQEDFVAEFAEGLDEPQDYTGRELTPAVRVTNGGEPLVQYDENTEEGDFKVQYFDNVIPGQARVVITGVNNYTGTKELYFDIMGNLSNEDQVVAYYEDSNKNLIAGTPRQIYTGSEITFGNPRIYLVLVATVDYPRDVVLEAGTDYKFSGSGETDNFISYGSVIYSGVESRYWKGDRTVRYDIDFNESEIYVNNNEGDYKYTGYPIIPKFTLNVSTANITAVEYFKDNIKIDPNKAEDKPAFTDKGTIEAVITYDVGRQTNNTARTTYNIVARPIDECIVEWDRDFHRYTGEAVEPGFAVSIKSKNLQDPDSSEQIYKFKLYDEETNTGDYEVDYGNNVYSTAEDDCAIVLNANADKLSGNLTGSRTCQFTIGLQSVANLRVIDKTGDSLTVKWVKELFSKGTQLKVEVKQSDGTYRAYMTTRIVGNTNEYKLEGLKGSTTYRITAKAYAEPEEGVTIYSAPKDVEDTTSVETSSITATRSASDPTKATITLPTGGNVLVYYIYRSTDTTSKGTLCAIVPRDTGAYTNTNLSSGVTYYYYVKGYAISDVTGKLEPVNQSEYVEAIVK
ncbi:hypothetical protein SAMN04487830_11351 [Pseudobutyrivibrio sp. OR37]|uniref:fibronectin type III domain-containing protein n=1 Tax=Pseudobutyrivibrio sp. OR37 TaxID=1798186 RepID=UPI0008F44DAA|nr:fibronectin type III domain-containing protein [Pseudobutyrivibrio sp. OR37]SFH93454.1 hypothetical protein SAMN04487830_11351 [Pseudobutyrivibrio sp. OR37]